MKAMGPAKIFCTSGIVQHPIIELQKLFRTVLYRTVLYCTVL